MMNVMTMRNYDMNILINKNGYLRETLNALSGIRSGLRISHLVSHPVNRSSEASTRIVSGAAVGNLASFNI